MPIHLISDLKAFVENNNYLSIIHTIYKYYHYIIMLIPFLMNRCQQLVENNLRTTVVLNAIVKHI